MKKLTCEYHCTLGLQLATDIFWRTADTDVVVLGVKTLAEKEELIADIVIGFGTRTKKTGMR